jgi:hypothetical protein
MEVNNNNNINRWIDIVLSIYLTIACLISFVFTLLAVIELGIDDLMKGIWFVVSLTAIFIFGINNYMILQKNVNAQKRYFINLLICIPQSFLFFSSGFNFKFTLGFEYVIAIKKINSELFFKHYPFNITHELIFNFIEIPFTMVGINLLSFLLVLFYSYRYIIKYVQ